MYCTRSLQVLIYVVDMPFTLLTTFDVVRDQYFFLGERSLSPPPPPPPPFLSALDFRHLPPPSDASQFMFYELLSVTQARICSRSCRARRSSWWRRL